MFFGIHYSSLLYANTCCVFLGDSVEFPKSEAEGLHQEGQKSTQTGPHEQLQTDDSAPVS